MTVHIYQGAILHPPDLRIRCYRRRVNKMQHCLGGVGGERIKDSEFNILA